MKKLIYVSLITLWSSLLFLSLEAKAGLSSPFVFVDVPGSKITEKSTYEVANMPRVRNQEMLPICGGTSTSVVAQHFVCKVNNISDCKNLPPEMEISPIAMLGYARKRQIHCTFKDNKYFDFLGTEVESDTCFKDEKREALPGNTARSFESYQYYGSSLLTLYNAALPFEFKTEACFKTDVFINKYGKTKDTMDKFINDMRNLYDKNKNNTEACTECIVQTANNLLITDQIDASTVQNALKKVSFQEFLYKLLFRKCENLKVSRNPLYYEYPSKIPGEEKLQPVKMKDFLKKITDNVKADHPMVLNGICSARDDRSGECAGDHAVVITGIKEVCYNGKCRAALKIQNSWGEDWQKEYNGGWVDAETLLNSKSSKKELGTFEGLISWYE